LGPSQEEAEQTEASDRNADADDGLDGNRKRSIPIRFFRNVGRVHDRKVTKDFAKVKN
jgi:hypothetical protein